MTYSRRGFLAGGLATGAALFTPGMLRAALAAPATAGAGPYGPLRDPDALGLMLPDGFTGRQIARGSKIVDGTTYPWHFASDGEATFLAPDGGWVLVSNSETPGVLGGGSSSISFDPSGTITGARRILAGTNLNCAGGPTPWGTWLSGEEHPGGMIWEADPSGLLPALPRPALGNFPHEAATVDPASGDVYLTEDQPDGLLYRFSPAVPGDLSSGVLQAATVAADGGVAWTPVPDPNIVTQGKETRKQVPGATTFDGGEGLWHHEGIVYFTTKGDRRVWALDVAAQRLEVLYDHRATPDAALNAVDNVTVSPFGDVYVCEDGGNMEIGMITPDRTVSPFVRLTGAAHEGSEMTGVVFAPTGDRMYFGSQRAYPYPGATGTPLADGAVYEVKGPFRLPAGGVPDSWIYKLAPSPLAGLPEGGPLRLRATAAKAVVRATVALDRPATVDLVLRTSDLRTASWHSGGPDRPVAVTLAAVRRTLPRGKHTVELPAVRIGRSLAATVIATAAVPGGRAASAVPLVL